MVLLPSTRASLRFGLLEFATITPTVLLWVFVMRAAVLESALLLYVLRVACMGALWWFTIRPARIWEQRGPALTDRELVEIDHALSASPPLFMRRYGVCVTLQVAASTLVALLARPRAIDFGGAELLCALMMVIAIVALLMVMQFWLWQPFDASRVEIGTLLHQRKLDVTRVRDKLDRSLLMLSTWTTVGIMFGCFGMGWLLNVVGMRNTAEANLRTEITIAAQQLREGEELALADAQLVQAAELPGSLDASEPLRSQIVVDLRRTAIVAATAVDEERWLLVERELDEWLGIFLGFTLVTAGFLSMPLIGTTLAHAHSLRDQLQSLGKLSRRVVEHGDIREIERLVSLRNDEVDELVKDFNTMLEMFHELAEVASRVAAGDLRVEIHRPGELHDAFRSMVERLHSVVLQIHGTAVDLATAAAEIHAFTREQSDAAEYQTNNMHAVSDTVASLAGSAERITATATQVLRDAEHTRDTTRGTMARIDELSRHATGVRELLERIREIADRSDLLALNGSLEAVRAGEAGRGFSLVAAEMRRLAERVTTTVDEVGVRVRAIDASGQATLQVAEASAGRAEQTAAAAQQISLLTNEQSEASERVATTVGEVAQVIMSMGAAIEQTQHAAHGLKQQAHALEQLTGQFQLRR